MKIGWNLACVCIVTVVCIAAVAVTGLAMGHDGTLVALAFTALGAIPAGLIAWGIGRGKTSSETKKKEEPK